MSDAIELFVCGTDSPVNSASFTMHSPRRTSRSQGQRKREDVAGALSTHVLLYEDTEEASHADTARRQIADGARLVADARAQGRGTRGELGKTLAFHLRLG